MKYVKNKEKIYRQKINDLEKQLGGTDTVNLKSIQEELLATKMKLDDIKSRKVDTLIDPYENLKDMIDKINVNIETIDKNVKNLSDDSTEETKKEIINKIRDINIALSTDPKDYTKIVTDSKINYVGERLNPQQITTIMDRYIDDTQALIDDAKTKLGGGLTGTDTLVNNEDFTKIFTAIRAKLEEFTVKLKPFKELDGTLQRYLENMESLFTINLEDSKPEDPGTANYLIDVDKLDENTGPELNLDQDELRLIREDERDISRLLDNGFLATKVISPAPPFTREESVEEPPNTPNPAEPGVVSRTEVGEGSQVKQEKGQPNNQPGPGGIVQNKGVPDLTSNSGQQKVTILETGEQPDQTSANRRAGEGQTLEGTPGQPSQPGRRVERTQLKGQPGQGKEQPYKYTGSSSDLSLERSLENKYLSLNNKYIQEPEFKEVKVTDESVNQTMNNLYKGWATKMSEYKSFLVAKKDNLDKATKYSKIIDTLHEQLNKIIEINTLLQISNDKTNTLKRDVDYKKTYYDGIKVALEKEDVIIKDLEENYGKAELLEIQKEITNKIAKVKESKSIMDTIKAFLKTKFLSRLIKIDSKKTQEQLDELTLVDLEKEIRNHEVYSYNKAMQRSMSSLVDLSYTDITALKQYIKQIRENKDFSTPLSLIESKLATISFNKKYLSTNFDPLLQSGGAPTHIHQVIEELREYENKVRNMKQVRKELESKIKVYNIRYVQYYNFQKYVVNYVSLKIAQGGYSYYQYVSKGLISYYQSLLTKLYSIIDKFDNFKKNSNDLDVQKSINKWIYGKHYFMIKILKKFFDELYIRWDEQAKENPDTWDLNSRQFKTDAFDKKYWFLFNIFSNILDKFSMNLPAIANYIRINEIKNKKETQPDGSSKYVSNIGKNTFEKGSKTTLDETALGKCDNEGANKNAPDISKIKFEEVFDPKNFEANNSLSSYMGLSNFLKSGKSIMILTYGYSGVGKSFTLFGKTKTNSDGSVTVSDGMLQSTLKYLGNTVNISVKAFELYGLGVPYKFYWKDPRKFCHYIYSYSILPGVAKINTTPTELNKDQMSNFLDKSNSNNYNEIKTNQIDRFSDIVDQIDTVRKSTGRIKATVNNPESSRSIMIYDFKINLNKIIDGKSFVHFVVMDLPGKENLFQTYCETADPNFDIDNKFTQFKDAPGSYDPKLLKAMFYMNPLWLSLIPETAMFFDKQNTGKHLSIRNPVGAYGPNGSVSGEGIGIYGTYDSKGSNTNTYLTSVYKSHASADKQNINQIRIGEHFTKQLAANQHLQFHIMAEKKGLLYSQPDTLLNVTDIAERKGIINVLGLRGLSERSMFTIVNLIKSGDLNELGKRLNDMLKPTNINIGTEKDPIMKTNTQLRYGYAGLEGVYINENILGLLQVLADRVRKIKGGANATLIPVVCEQIENYRKIITKIKPERIPIDITILNDKNNNQLQLNGITNQERFIESIDPKQAFFVDEDEFYSQIVYMMDFSTTTIGAVSDYQDKKPTQTNIEKDENLYFNTKLRDSKFNNDLDVLKYVNNYDYNKIFNSKEPPIKKILEPYLESIDNYYLFFVVSNNLKSSKTGDIETCDKQMKLLYDTKTFMSVISAENDDQIEKIKCEL